MCVCARMYVARQSAWVTAWVAAVVVVVVLLLLICCCRTLWHRPLPALPAAAAAARQCQRATSCQLRRTGSRRAGGVAADRAMLPPWMLTCARWWWQWCTRAME